METLTPHLYIVPRPSVRCGPNVAGWMAAPRSSHRHPWGSWLFPHRQLPGRWAPGYIVPPSRACCRCRRAWDACCHHGGSARSAHLNFTPIGPGAAAPTQPRKAAGAGAGCSMPPDLLRAVVREPPTVPDDSQHLSAQDQAREHHLRRAVARRSCAVPVPCKLGVNLPRTSACAGSARPCWPIPRYRDSWRTGRHRDQSAHGGRDCFSNNWNAVLPNWRQQVVLAHAVSLAARNWPIQRIAAGWTTVPAPSAYGAPLAVGYASGTIFRHACAKCIAASALCKSRFWAVFIYFEGRRPQNNICSGME